MHAVPPKWKSVTGKFDFGDIRRTCTSVGGSPHLIPLGPIDATLLAPTRQGSVAEFGERPAARPPHRLT